MKHNTINSRECLSLPKDEIDHDDSNNNDDNTSHDNTISHDDACVLKEDFNSYQVKCMKKLQNVKDAFLKKLSDISQNLEKNLDKKEYDERYERLLNQLEKKNLFLKTIFLLLLIIFIFESLYLQHQQACLEIVFLTVRIQMRFYF